MKLSMCPVDSRIVFVSEGEISRSEVRTSLGIFIIFSFGDVPVPILQVIRGPPGAAMPSDIVW